MWQGIDHSIQTRINIYISEETKDMMDVADLDEIKFAKALVNPEKAIRDATLSNLRKVLTSSKGITELQMLKLWKALFYCFWLADMNAVQMELATNLAENIAIFPKYKGSLLYVEIFFRTIVREWHHLDQYRLDKFYSLIRSMLQKIFLFIRSKKWKTQIVEQFLVILESEVLMKVPNGVRYHMADIYLAEIWKAFDGDISTEQFIMLLGPFISALSNMNDKTFHRRIVKKIFEAYLHNHAAEHETSSEKPHIFRNVSTASLQDIIFESASEEGTREGHRRVLYDLHRNYQLAGSGNTVTKESNEQKNKTKSNQKSGKKKIKDTSVEEDKLMASKPKWCRQSVPVTTQCL